MRSGSASAQWWQPQLLPHTPPDAAGEAAAGEAAAGDDPDDAEAPTLANTDSNRNEST